ncbi:hypothetical protein BIW11_04207 [Tropilaelaps mercedesae]|uniref:Uncharacterized protein n=1 Tax=Tropilaelaps mercedesae TaxID=418985 RepID=A0A1V9X9X0_9ACAR|nr:hypothetical protein BIW11_04207 [Tropilaelaps mercedesae]
MKLTGIVGILLAFIATAQARPTSTTPPPCVRDAARPTDD